MTGGAAVGLDRIFASVVYVESLNRAALQEVLRELSLVVAKVQPIPALLASEETEHDVAYRGLMQAWKTFVAAELAER